MARANGHSDGVVLRTLEIGDCEVVHGWIRSEDELYQWSGPWEFSWPLDLDQLVRDARFQSESRFLFAVTEPGGGELLGHVKLQVQRHHGLGLIGRVLVAPQRRGQGVGTAMMHRLVGYAFDDLGLHRLQLGVYTFNTPAIACYEAAGFVVEGRLRDSTRGSGGYWDGLIMGLLASDRDLTGGRARTGRDIRLARQGDHRRIAELLTLLGYPHDAAQARERLRAWAGNPDGTVLVTDVDGSPAGVIAVHAVPYFERPGAFARIVALSVDAERRRQGIGRRLVGAAEAWAVRRGCADMEVTSQRGRHDAQRFYTALGYEDRCERSGRLTRALGADLGGTGSDPHVVHL